MFKGLIIALSITAMTLSLVGCNKPTIAETNSSANTYDKVVCEYDADLISYKAAIQNILNCEGSTEDAVNSCISNHKDLISLELQEYLLLNTVDLDENPEMEDMTFTEPDDIDEFGIEEYDESMIPDEAFIDSESEVESNTEDYSIDSDIEDIIESKAFSGVDSDGNPFTVYPIYGTDGSIYDFGTKEDSIKSYESTISIETFVVSSVDVYQDKAVASVTILGLEPCKVVFNLIDNKLGLYDFYYY